MKKIIKKSKPLKKGIREEAKENGTGGRNASQVQEAGGLDPPVPPPVSIFSTDFLAQKNLHELYQ